MKRLLLILLSACMAVGVWAQPILVGHRGSGYGLENSEESFRKGIELGYKYLETDVKFSKDLRLVCSHDDDTKRLGGTKTLATSTLEELQSETLTQTRNGVKYTGRICSMKEYLEICKEGGVGALIELKWTDGINNNDCSRIPMLIEQIEEVDMRKNCIILTSMKPCLEYIRTNYPDIELQFLTGEYWSNHFDWCVNWNIDVDIQVGYFDKSTVQKYHDKNLKVNMWTTNDDAGYKTYGNMGCDFITTDRLDGHNLPELNADVTFPPNTADYPNSSYQPEIKSRYDIDNVTLGEYPAALAGRTVKRAVKSSSGWYVLTLDEANTPALFFVADSGETSQMSLEGITEGDISLNNIAITADGKLVGCNLTIVTNDDSTTRPWKTYIWDNPQATPREFIFTQTFSEAGNWISGVIGNSFAVTGLEKELKIYTTSRSASGSTYRVCGFDTKNGEIVSAVYALDNTYTAANWGDFDLTVSPWSRSNIIVSAPGKTATEYTFEWSGTRLPMSEYAVFDNRTPALLPEAASFVRYGAKLYTLVPQHKGADGGLTATVYDATGGIGALTPLTDALNLCDSKAGYTATAIRTIESGNNPLSVFIENVGIISANFAPVEPEPEPEDLKLQLERLWIQSNTTDNHPGDIDGTNAQQGTAVNGLFYVNNCSEKLIHIFNETGHLGTIRGGAGWGCARDDAGNIIVRDDKLTGNTHSFIIYPAGASVDNPGTPVEITVDVPLTGQTNFINASGDVLNDGGGFIYLFPNGQAAINIVEMANGEVKNTYQSADLNYQGSTAGYIYPLNNDRENWFYQVRSSAIVRYSGGNNTEFMGGRTGTAAPQRNTSVGFAVIKEGGNYILIHNSGSNYKGGFTVRDITLDKVIATVEPIGTLGYETGGNYSVGNWTIVERIGKANYLLYQYCPANGIALYRLHNPEESGIEASQVVNAEDKIYTDGTDITAPGASTISVYDLSGKQVMTVNGDSANIEQLTAGIYIVRTNLGVSRKIAR